MRPVGRVPGRGASVLFFHPTSCQAPSQAWGPVTEEPAAWNPLSREVLAFALDHHLFRRWGDGSHGALDSGPIHPWSPTGNLGAQGQQQGEHFRGQAVWEAPMPTAHPGQAPSALVLPPSPSFRHLVSPQDFASWGQGLYTYCSQESNGGLRTNLKKDQPHTHPYRYKGAETAPPTCHLGRVLWLVSPLGGWGG